MIPVADVRLVRDQRDVRVRGAELVGVDAELVGRFELGSGAPTPALGWGRIRPSSSGLTLA